MDVSQARRVGWWRWLSVAAGAAILVSLPGLIAAWPVNPLAIPIEQLYARIPDYKVDASRPPVQHVAQVRGVESLYLNYTPSA